MFFIEGSGGGGGGGSLRGSGKWSRTGAMSVLAESMNRERPKSPHMNNEEPIELAHFPDAHPPKPNDQAKIERDDFPAPPYPYTDPGEVMYFINLSIIYEAVEITLFMA